MGRAAALLILCSAAASAQLSSSISLNNGVQLQVAADLGNPTGQQQLTVEMARASGNSFYRIFRDQNGLAVFAYELAVDLTPNGDALRATAKPAELAFAARYPDADAGKPVPTLSQDRALGPLASGQSARLDLFEIPGMGVKVGETIRVQFSGEAEGGDLRFSGLRVSLDGREISGPPPPGAVSGRYVMFYLPGRGGYFFSTAPVAERAFAKSGSVEGARMRFTVENITFECVASAPILTRGGNGEVWVFHDPSYRPDGNWTKPLDSASRQEQFFMAASDSLNWWLR